MIRGNGGGCTLNPDVHGTLQENAPFISAPPDNSSLLAYAQSDGKVYSGTTADRAERKHGLGDRERRRAAVGESRQQTRSSTSPTCAGCSATYSPYNVTYSNTSPCGNVYVRGTYSSSLTIAAANDIIIDGNVTTNLSGTAVLGLVANNFIRVQHGVTTRSRSDRLFLRLGLQRRGPVAREPTHRRRRAGHSPFVHRRQLRLRRAPRTARGERRHRAALPRDGGNLVGRVRRDRLPEGLHLRRPAALSSSRRSCSTWARRAGAWVAGRCASRAARCPASPLLTAAEALVKLAGGGRGRG